MSVNDTIVALSTPVGESAIGVIRVSGNLCKTLILDISGRKKDFKPRQACLSKYLSINDLEIDNVIFIRFTDKKSYTGEEMIEIFPHGNPLILQNILQDLITRGCRLAEPGEFTKRAFLNGRIDLSQAEAVADIIKARSNYSLEIAKKQLDGSIGKKISELTNTILSIIAHMEAYIDFPEEDLPKEDIDGPVKGLLNLIAVVDDLIFTNKYASILKDGLKIVILGEPNAGKSSLINKLLGRERALVSNIEGTTRDFITDFTMINDFRVELIDTAGIHEAKDEIEIKGIAKTMEIAKAADLYLVILDHTKPSPLMPIELSRRFTSSNCLVIENKQDLLPALPHSKFLSKMNHISISLKEDKGIEELRDSISELIQSAAIKPKAIDGIILNARHTEALKKASHALKNASESIDNQEFSEIIVSDLRQALDYFGEVIGKVDNELMLDKLFAKFCIGK